MSSPEKVEPTPLLIFDGDCAFCTRSVRFIERRIRRHPRIQPWQRSDLAELGLTQEQCETAVQLIDGDRLTSAHVAIARVLIYGKRGWAVLGYLLLVPGIKQIAGVVYRWVAKNRDRMPGGTAECALPQSERTERKIGDSGSAN
jgi:predicted DCC family thiol-disulfide oxidoreductase YuxK